MPRAARVPRTSRLITLVVAGIALLATTPGCRSTCEPSTPPRRGSIHSCCGGGTRAYYWDGKTCQPDTACQCDSLPAKPSWPTYDECRSAHLSCPGAQLPPKPSPQRIRSGNRVLTRGAATS